MSKASGLFLIAVGVGVAAYTMPFRGDDADQQLAQEISTAKMLPPA